MLLCTGKVYYDLAAARAERGHHRHGDRPRSSSSTRCPSRQLQPTLDRYPNAEDVRWVQEEPANQGAWTFLGLALPEKCPERLSHVQRVSRRRMAAPAAGSSQVHEVEQAEIVAKAFDEPPDTAAETAKSSRQPRQTSPTDPDSRGFFQRLSALVVGSSNVQWPRAGVAFHDKCDAPVHCTFRGNSPAHGRPVVVNTHDKSTRVRPGAGRP